VTTTGAVAIVVVNFNGGEYLDRCLRSIESQSRRPDHVIVVDNASADGSMRAAQTRFPGFRYVANGTNVGFAAANNQAFDLCSSLGVEYVALLNPDAFAAPDWLAKLLDAAGEGLGYASWASCLLRADAPAEVDGLGDAYHICGSAWRRRHGQPLERAWLVDRDVFCACAAAALYRLDAVRSVGGFDSDLFCYMEDVDLGFRLRLMGHSCRLVSAAKVEHVGSGITGYRSNTATYYGQRNLVWVFAKNMPPALIWLLLPLHVIMNTMMVVVCTLRGQFAVVARAKLDALKGLKGLPAKRRAIQSSAIAPTSAIWRALSKSLVPGS
jgi:GT2 family glycosyltransferase